MTALPDKHHSRQSKRDPEKRSEGRNAHSRVQVHSCKKVNKTAQDGTEWRQVVCVAYAVLGVTRHKLGQAKRFVFTEKIFEPVHLLRILKNALCALCVYKQCKSTSRL